MGNQASRGTAPGDVETILVEELPNVVYKGSLGASNSGVGGVDMEKKKVKKEKTICAREKASDGGGGGGVGSGRFFKTSLCIHDAGPVVVKSYIHNAAAAAGGPGGGGSYGSSSSSGGGVVTQKYEDALLRVQAQLRGVENSHVWANQWIYQSRCAVHLVRQYQWASLAQRLTSRPFLSRSEKIWIVYQLLESLVQAHGRGVCHGDIKAENVLITSWSWVFLGDFAPYKPVVLPMDNPVCKPGVDDVYRVLMMVMIMKMKKKKKKKKKRLRVCVVVVAVGFHILL